MLDIKATLLGTTGSLGCALGTTSPFSNPGMQFVHGHGIPDFLTLPPFARPASEPLKENQPSLRGGEGHPEYPLVSGVALRTRSATTFQAMGREKMY